VRSRSGHVGALRQIAADRQLQAELRQLAAYLKAARSRLEKKRNHRVRNTLVAVGAAVTTAAALPQSRQWLRHQSKSFRDGREDRRETEAKQAA
jgi:hypothetical protein